MPLPFRCRFRRAPRGPLLATAALGALLTFLSPSSHAETAKAPGAMAQAVRATLPNGLRVVIVPDPLAPVVQTQMIYLAGSANAPEGFPGTAHALEHMMFNGAKELGRDQLSTLSARIGDNNNAFTTEDTTQFYFEAPAQNLGLLLHIEADRMRGALLTEKDWQHERGAIEQEVSRDLSSPVERYLVEQSKTLFAGTPYEHDALGTRPSFDKTDAALLRRFYDAWYEPNNAILLIVGDVDPKATLAQVQAQFGALPAGQIPPRPVIHPAPVEAKTIRLDSDLGVGFVTVAFRMPGAADPDYAAAQILADVLGSQRGALFALVPQGKALQTEVEYSPHAQAGSAVVLAVFPKGADSGAVLENVRGVLAEIRAHGVPAELVEAAKRKEIASLEFDADSISDLTESWANALALNNVSSPAALVDAFRAVTPEKVNALARTLLDPAHALTGILTPTESPNPAAMHGKGGETFITPPSHPVTLPEWARAELATIALPPAAPRPAAFTLPNGLHLLVLPEHVSHTVKLYGRIRHEDVLEQPSGQDGVAELTGGLFMYGSTTRDRLKLAADLDAIAAEAAAGFAFEASALTPAFDQAVTILADNELHPAFPAHAFTVLKAQAVAGRPGIMQSPAYRFRRAVLRALNPPGDPTLRETTPASLAHLTLDDVKAFYRAAYRPDLTTIIVIGDTTPEHARALITQEFGAWKAEGPTPVVDLPPRPPNPASKTVVPDAGRLQDQVLLLQTIGGGGVQNPDRYALEMGNEILGSGFSSRLMQDLRVRTGYAYSAGSGVQWSRNRGTFLVSFGSDPDKVAAARAAAVAELQAMQGKPVSDDELTSAKASLLRGMPMNRASFDTLAGGYLSYASLGLPLDEADRQAHAFYAMTPDAILTAWKHWIRPDDLAQAVRGPNPG